jgi:D-3-phosphoglycerate dehydrogenase
MEDKMAFEILSTSPTFGYYALEPVEYLQSHNCKIELVPPGKKISEEELIGKIAHIDAMIVGIETITDKALQAAQRLKIIAKHGAGVDNIDVAAATGKGIALISAPGANSDAVADLTVGLFLALAREIPSANRSVRGGDWPRIVGTQFNGKVLGIIGLGQIGKKVARRAQGFDMKILAYDIAEDESFAREWGVNYVTLDELLMKSDFVSIHIPLGPSTRRMIGQRELSLMKKEAFLVNISRGDIVDEEALYRALKELAIRGAALDVFQHEPPEGSPLVMMDNVIATPHMGAYTMEALRDTGMICVQGIVDILQGRRPQNVINQGVFE